MIQPKIPANMLTQHQTAMGTQALIIAPNGSAHQENQGSVQKYFGKNIDVSKTFEVVEYCRKNRANAMELVRFANVRTLIRTSN